MWHALKLCFVQFDPDYEDFIKPISHSETQNEFIMSLKTSFHSLKAYMETLICITASDRSVIGLGGIEIHLF